MKIKISEIFYSMQGEGLYTGTPSLFMRVFGCNFTCQGFGMPKGQLSNEYLNVDPSKYEKYDALPLVHTGCDSYPSWDVRFKSLSPMMTVEQIVDRMQELLPNGKFGPVHLVITGGEPLLGWQRAYPALFNEIKKRQMDLDFVTFETNGTQPLVSNLFNSLIDHNIETTFSVSAKLPSSGESFDEAICPDVVSSYIDPWINYEIDRYHNIYFKFVVSNPDDMADVQSALDAYGTASLFKVPPVYLMPSGGTEQGYFKNKQWVAKECLARGYRFAQRLHIDLYGNQWGT